MPETQDHTHVCTDVGLVPDIKDVNSRQRVVEMWEGIDVRECRNSPRTIGVDFLNFLYPSSFSRTFCSCISGLFVEL